VTPRVPATRLALCVIVATSVLPLRARAQVDSEPPPKPAAAWANFDFVPGEKVLFAEDFSKDRVGNFPQRFELANGNAEVVQWKGKTWLRVTSAMQFRVKLPQTLPDRFTVEFDLIIPWNGMAFTTEHVKTESDQQIGSEGLGEKAYVYLSGTEAGVARGPEGAGKSMVDPRTVLTDLFAEDAQGFSRPVKVRVQVDGKYAKVYLDEARVANIPNAEFARGKEMTFLFHTPGVEPGGPAPLLTNLSINAGGQPLYDALLAKGRVATQGIFFDVGSDHIRPESAPTLQMIGDMLKAHADLKLTIEGHTDNTGTAAANKALSDKRAAAVKAYLTSTFGIGAERLASAGLGDTKPAAPNTSAEGRQQNRRVELVKM
jgi:OOP family OmpA-OmpF porin